MALKEQYIDIDKFLPRSFSNDAYLLKSGTDTNTILSAYSFMSGVYPKGFSSVAFTPGINPLTPD
jgi:hypothetical protein